MKVIKILNNNSLIVLDAEENESILIGRGLAFGKKTGDTIDEGKADKRYNLDQMNDKAEVNKLIHLIEEIPLETVKISTRIVDYIRNKLDRPISQNIEVAITDHLHYALMRLQKGVVFENYFLWEMKRFYPEEYEATLEAIRWCNERYHTELPDSEASFVTLHIVRDSFENGNMQQVLKSTKLIHDILSIVQYHFNVELDTECYDYQRFITHLKFFAGRFVTGNMLEEREYYLYDFMRMKYPEVFECAMKIDALLQQELTQSASQEELAYLMIHIERVLHKKKS